MNGAVVDVEGANVSWNGRYGINVDGAILEMRDYGGKENVIQWNGLDGVHVENPDSNLINAHISYISTKNVNRGRAIGW